MQHKIAPQRLTVCVAPGASTHATAFMPRRGNTLYMMPNKKAIAAR
ncbi:MAG: hypothetical protein V7L00_20485 [Nostoc sp.]